MKSSIVLVLSIFAPSEAFLSPTSQSRSTSLYSSAPTSRTDFLRDIAAVGFTAATTAAAGLLGSSPAYADEITPSGVAIKVTKSGNGPEPKIGEMAAIRFAAYQGETKIDDIFSTVEPYYTRIGSGGLIKGVEEVLPKMRVGDRWVLTVPVSVSAECRCFIFMMSRQIITL